MSSPPFASTGNNQNTLSALIATPQRNSDATPRRKRKAEHKSLADVLMSPPSCNAKKRRAKRNGSPRSPTKKMKAFAKRLALFEETLAVKETLEKTVDAKTKARERVEQEERKARKHFVQAQQRKDGAYNELQRIQFDISKNNNEIQMLENMIASLKATNVQLGKQAERAENEAFGSEPVSKAQAAFHACEQEVREAKEEEQKALKSLEHRVFVDCYRISKLWRDTPPEEIFSSLDLPFTRSALKKRPKGNVKSLHRGLKLYGFPAAASFLLRNKTADEYIDEICMAVGLPTEEVESVEAAQAHIALLQRLAREGFCDSDDDDSDDGDAVADENDHVENSDPLDGLVGIRTEGTASDESHDVNHSDTFDALVGIDTTDTIITDTIITEEEVTEEEVTEDEAEPSVAK